jgi:endonuclease YncB( thermonuclease family)
VGYHLKSLAIVAGLFAFSFQMFSNAFASNDCKPDKLDLAKDVAIVYDGSSFLIERDYVTLTGVYVPSAGLSNRREETGGRLAAELVGKLIKDFKGKVGLELDTRSSEKGKVMAHLYLPNGRNLAEILLEKGLAFVDTELPNTKHLQCYREAEARARTAKKGIWQYQERGVPVIESKNLTGERDGFQIVRGKITLVREGSDYFLLNMDTLGIRIPKNELSRFSVSDLKGLKDKTIEVRGELKFHKGNMFVRIHHPGQIDLLAEKWQPNVKPTKK